MIEVSIIHKKEEKEVITPALASTMVKQKMVIKVTMSCEKCRTKALQIAAQSDGVESVELKGEDDDAAKNQIMVIGESVNIVALTKSLRKKVGHAELVSVADFDEDEA